MSSSSRGSACLRVELGSRREIASDPDPVPYPASDRPSWGNVERRFLRRRPLHGGVIAARRGHWRMFGKIGFSGATGGQRTVFVVGLFCKCLILCGPCGDRTHDRRVKSPLLCQLS